MVDGWEVTRLQEVVEKARREIEREREQAVEAIRREAVERRTAHRAMMDDMRSQLRSGQIDEEGLRTILKNLVDASTPGARLFVIEHVIPEPSTAHFAKLFDIHMMCWGTGRERTAQEYISLMDKSGWRFEGAHAPREGLMSVLQAVRA